MEARLAKQLLDEFLPRFDDVTIKTFFSGFSLNSGDVMFGWVGKSNLYLRAHSSYRDTFIEQGMSPLVLPTGVITKFLDYYQVGNDLLSDKNKLYAIISMVIDCAKQEKQNKNAKKELRIKDLPNMTLSLERRLYSVGISDVQTFQLVGYLESFRRISEKQKNMSINILFILYSALHKIHVGVLSASLKEEIALSYQQFVTR